MFISDHNAVCILCAGGVYSFGNGCAGQLGHGDHKSRFIPQRVEAFDMFDIRVRNVAAGYSRSIFVSESGVAYWCGDEIMKEPRLHEPAGVSNILL